MNLYKYIFWILLIVTASACTKNEFFIEFKLPAEVETNIDAVYYADSKKGGAIVQGTLAVIGGECQFRGVTALPTVIYLTHGGIHTPIILYAEKGNKILVTGDTSDPYDWTFSGNKINEELSLWRNENKDILTNGKPDAINRSIAEYVKKNNESPAAALLLYTTFCRDEDEALFEKLRKLLSDKAADEKWINLIARADLMAYPGFSHATMKSFKMRAYPEGVKTIVADSAEATFITFWHSGLDNKKQIFEKLREISEEYPDSSGAHIVDVNIDTDSLAWRNNLRRDTIEGVTRLWVPTGYIDATLTQLGVHKVPYYIVLDKGGVQKYRGSNVDSALNTLKTLLKSRPK